jgi:hypothetical protein
MVAIHVKSEASVPKTDQGVFSSALRTMLLATSCITGCGTEPSENPLKTQPATSSSSTSPNSTIEKSHQSGPYYFNPPLVAPKEFAMAVSTPGGFSAEDASYINNGAYFVFRALESERPDLAKEFQKLKFSPFTQEMLRSDVAGGKFPFGIYENGTVHINVKSREFPTAGAAFFPLARTIAHEFCHHLAGDKTIDNLGADATKLFSYQGLLVVTLNFGNAK